MDKKNFMGVACAILVLAGAIFLIAGARDLGAAEKVDEVRIGAVFPLTGSGAEMGRTAKRGIDIMVREFNNTGGINNLGGAKLRIIYGDNRSIPDVSRSEGERLVRLEDVRILLGAHPSGLTVPLTDAAERLKTPHVVCGGVVDMLTERGYKYIFRQALKSSWAWRDIAAFLHALGQKYNVPIKTIAIVHEDSDWGQGASKRMYIECEKLGIRPVLHEGYPSEAPDLTPLVIKLKGLNADAIMMYTYIPDGIQLTKLMAQYKVSTKAWLGGGGGMVDPGYLKAVGSLSDHMMSASVWAPDLASKIARVKIINDLYVKEYGVYMGEAAGYTTIAMDIVKDALERTKSIEREDIRIALAGTKLKLGDTNAPYPISFDKDGQNPDATVIMCQMKDAQMNTVYPFAFANPNHKLVFPFPPWDKR